MTKADIVNEVAKATGMEKIAVQNVVESFMESVKDSLAKNKNVYLRGFGSFVVKKRAKKTARNISKNTTLIIPELITTCLKFLNILIDVRAGKMIILLISIVPIILIPTTITTAVSIAIKFVYHFTFKPVAFAKSSSNVTINSFL